MPEPSVPPARLERLGAGVWAHVHPRGGWGETNVGLVVGDGASLVVDTPWDVGRAHQVLDAFGDLTVTAPVGLAVNTHADPDHWWGNDALPADCRIVTSEAALAGMRAESGPRELGAIRAAARTLRRAPGPPGALASYLETVLADVRAPSRLRLPGEVFTSATTLDVGGRPVRLSEQGPAHTGGDVVVHVPDEGVVFAGDLLFVASTPIMWHGPLEKWVDGLEWMLSLDADLFVPGHGPTCAAGRVRELRDYWLWVAAEALPHFAEGRSPLAAARAMLVGSAQPWTRWHHPERLVISLHTLWRQWCGRRLRPPGTRRARALADAGRLRRLL